MYTIKIKADIKKLRKKERKKERIVRTWGGVNNFLKDNVWSPIDQKVINKFR
jgi:hypothetical protein